MQKLSPLYRKTGSNNRISRETSTTSEQGLRHFLPLEWLVMLWLCFLALATLAISSLVSGSKEKFLYHIEGAEDPPGFPVVEYIAPESFQSKEHRERLRPNFLYSTSGFSPPPRVVEFYAPWCPHCQHFKPKYLKLADKVHSAQSAIKFYAVSCVAYHDLCKDQNVTGYPTIKLFRGNSYEVRTVKLSEVNSDNILRELGYSVEAEKTELADTSKATHKNEIGRKEYSTENYDKGMPIARVVPFQMHEVNESWSDAALSFEFALKHGIYMENGPLSKEKQDAFREWMELLSKALPPQMERTHKMINIILGNFSVAAEGQSHLDTLISQNFSVERSRPWHTCTYGNNKMGYTCGLWQLFHIMTIGVVEYNRHNPAIATRHASETLRNYIDHFFQCDVCRINFLDMYDSCAFDGCHRLSDTPSSNEHDSRELPMWLWEVHNDVNVRLMGERLELNKEAKPSSWESQQARWPSLFSCPNCWREDKSWDEDHLFEHLRISYWSGNPRYIKIESSSKENGGNHPLPLGGKVVCVICIIILIAILSINMKRSYRKVGIQKES